jgi:DNA-binding NarL/FixJ family response regulator
MKHIDPSSYLDPDAGVIPFDRAGRTVLLVTISHHGTAEATARIQAALPGAEIADLSPRSVAQAPDTAAGTPATLTHRQREILNHLLDGLSNKEIARKLGLSHFTVRNHVSNILRMTGHSCRRTMRRALTVERRSAPFPASLVA